MKIISPQAIVVGLEPVNLNDFPDLKVIGCNMTSCEHLPLTEMAERGIELISLKGHTPFLKYITSTAEHTIGLILALFRNYQVALNGSQDREVYKGHTLSDKVIGIVGFGRVGKQLKKIAVGLSMTVITHDKAEPYLTNLLEESDIVTLHIPLEGNEGFFTKEMFQQMKPTSYFINTSRLEVVEPGALLWALENDIIKGAAVDFIEPELFKYAQTHHNLLLTNHIGGCTYEDMAKTEEFIISLVNNHALSHP